MRIERLTVSGMECFSPENPVEITFGKRTTVVIGPNNVGKSSIFRLLHMLKSFLPVERKGLSPYTRISTQLQNNLWWRHDVSVPVTAQFLVNGLPPSGPIDYRDPVSASGQASFSYSLVKGYQSDFLVFNPCYRQRSDQSFVQSFPDLEQKLISTDQDRVQYNFDELKQDAVQLLDRHVNQFVDSMFVFDPIRALDRNTGSREMHDGSGFIAKLHLESQDVGNAKAFADKRERMIEMVNELMVPSGSQRITNFETKLFEDVPELWLYVDGTPIPLKQMGTGIAEIILGVSYLAEYHNRKMFWLLEEPETHLHPGLLRRYITLLQSQENIQLLINTHSPVILDCLNEADSLYHLRRSESGCAVAVPAAEFTQRHALLDSLGVTASSLLQSNCTIWVEGQSDRLYVRRMLDEYADVQGEKRLLENSDYSFSLYGGAVLSHFDLDSPTDQNDFVSMLAISRFSAVLMDRDLTPEQSIDSLKEYKKKIQAAAVGDAVHRRAYITDGLEIENDVPLPLMREALSEQFRLQLGRLDNLTFTGMSRFHQELKSHVGEKRQGELTTNSAESNKVAIAMKVVNRSMSDSGIRIYSNQSYIPDLFDFIVRAQNPDVNS